MINYELALNSIKMAAHPLPSERVPLLSALGRIASEEVLSPAMSPPFDNSAMDGFALNAAETTLASPESPIFFNIKEIVAAGQVSPFFGKGTAIKIMTGALLPKGYNAVLKVENAQVIEEHNGSTLCITSPINPGENSRCCGEDIQYQDRLIRKGDYINANRLMTLATAGVSALTVKRQPELCIISTGNEIVDNYERLLSEGEIYNSNYPYLVSVLQASGLKANYLGNFADDLSSYKTRINCLLDDKNGPDIIISTGAVSKGDYDYIPDALRELGADIVFHGVNIRPGKPILFATFGRNYYFGLPGNPISAAVGYQFFIRPLIRALQELPRLPPVFALLDNPFLKKGSFRQFLKARAYINKQAQLCVTILMGQESFKVRPLLKANAWVIVEEEMNQLNSGDLVPIILMPYCHIEEIFCE